MRKSLIAFTVLCAGALTTDLQAQQASEPASLVLIGEVAPRAASEIAANNWSIGTETIDRDFSTYDAWRAYLGPLGAKQARLQGGWARTDRGGGHYDFAWLDGIVMDMNAQGVRPWVTLGYGNPAYTGGGTAQRDSELPTGAGRAAWLAYVDAAVRRYRGQIDYWEMWNEPDLIGKFSGREFGIFAAETARVVRRANPAAIISVAGFAGVGSDGRKPFVVEALTEFRRTGGPGLADVVGYHAYALNPDTSYAGIDLFRSVIAPIDPKWRLRQGEGGAPSINQPLFALSNIWWTEEAQAKWMLRRMLGDASRSIWTSVFTITDLHYTVQAENNASFVTRPEQRSASVAMNTKGLLETRRYAPGTPDDDRTVVRAKIGYRAMQSMTSIFDSRLRAIPGACSKSRSDITVAAFGRRDGRYVVAAWRSSDRPGDRPMHEKVSITCTGVRFASSPLFVDPLTSTVYRTDNLARTSGGRLTLENVPVYDSPVLVIDPALVTVW